MSNINYAIATSLSNSTGINVVVMVASFVSVGYNVLFLLDTYVTKITREPIYFKAE